MCIKKNNPDAAIFLEITGNPRDPLKHPYANVEGKIIVYGVKGYQTDVAGVVYDELFSTAGGNLTLQTNLDINGFSIIGLKRRYIIQGTDMIRYDTIRFDV